MNLKDYENRNIEVETQFNDVNTGEPIIKFLHGIMKSEDNDSIKLLDFRDGEMTIRKNNIVKVRAMGQNETDRVMNRLTTINSRLHINPEIKRDKEMLDKKLRKFREEM